MARPGAVGRGKAGLGRARVPMAHNGGSVSERFERNPETDAAVSRLLKHAEGMKRGDVLRWEDFARLARVASHRDGTGHTIEQRFRKALLRDKRIATRGIPGVGIKLLEGVGQVVDVARERHRKMYRQAGKLTREVGVVPAALIPERVRRLQAAHLQGAREERKLSASMMRVVSVLAKQKEALPRRSSAGA